MATPKLFGAEIPFVHHLGFQLVKMEGGASELTFEPRPEHMNSMAVAHGGTLMTLLDVAMATAARSMVMDTGVLTIEMKTTFMQPSTGLLTGRGRLMQRTRSMAFTEATLHDAHGRLCAHATGTFKYVPRRPDTPSGTISTD